MKIERFKPYTARRSAIFAAIFVTVVALLSAVSCGSKLPEIATLEWRLESRPSETGPDYESLSVFASIRDEDGLDNIDELWVIDDDSAFAWELTDSNWIKVTEGGDTWIGGSALTVPEFEGLPRGTYRMVVIDAAGQRVERAFRLSGSFPDKRAPTVSISKGKISVGSAWPETLALAFDGTGALLSSPGAPALPFTLTATFGPELASRVAEIGAYGYDPSLRMGAFSKRVKTR